MLSSRRLVVDASHKLVLPSLWRKSPGVASKCLCSTTSDNSHDGDSEKKSASKFTPDYYQSKWYNKQTEAGISGKTMRKATHEEKMPTTADKFMKMWNHSEQMARNMARAGIKLYRGSNKGPNVTEKDDFSVEYKIPNLQDNIFQLPQRYFDALQAKQQVKKEGKVVKRVVDFSAPKSVTFEDLNITTKLVEKLELRGITRPFPIQEIAIPTVVRGKSIVFQSETGSGKTLVFLLPTLQDPGRAFGTIILVPTRELVSQMMFEAQSLLKDKSIVASFVSGVDQTEQERILNSDKLPRIAIATPKRMWEIVRKYTEHFTRTKRIVIDEVDKVLLPISLKASKERLKYRGLKPRPGKLLVDAVQETSKATIQLIASSATVDRLLIGEMEDIGWGRQIEVVKPQTLFGKTKNVPPTIKHMFVGVDEVSGVTKAAVLARLFRESGQTSALVFIRSTDSVDEFMWELREHDINAQALYKRLEDTVGFGQFLEDFRSGKVEIVVANEETVRGLDLPDLEHVYLVEVPKNADHYVHLAGRVGRQGKKGTCTTLVTNALENDKRRLSSIYKTLRLVCEEIEE